ncbi:DUF4398 domain-containing protein [Rhizobacter sp. J219]|uniref:DUF4398 domain-containing protein n=1 Tax=Rhizobacter sp. J219 TaxID=2898430 RepID=UPI00215144D7|nr:DUF4398 domain-containing protein [Rhizobacter sp. J219]MCR5882347.1 DUF4398 domain-containing protein [Rhizobacter sp. J219]
MTHLVSTPVATGLLMAVLAGVMTACASVPPPTQQMALADAAVQRASSMGTADMAPAELQLAKSKLARAKEANETKQYERAARLAEQAQLDAEVAEMHAQAVRSRKAARETQDAAAVLREEIDRKTPRERRSTP